MIEINGPAQTFFGEGDERVVYRTLGLMSTSYPELVKTFGKTLQFLKDNSKEDTILFWRRHPVLEEERDNNAESTGKFKIVCRLGFYPELPEEVWNKVCIKKEGESCNDLNCKSS